MIGADVLRRLEPVAGGLGQDMALIRNAGNDAIEGAQTIRGNDDAFAARQVVILPHLAAIIFGQFGNKSFFQDAHDDRSENGQEGQGLYKGCFRYRMFRLFGTRILRPYGPAAAPGRSIVEFLLVKGW
ncbi:hypothetical protein D3C73_1128880 [compost metagenome]